MFRDVQDTKGISARVTVPVNSWYLSYRVWSDSSQETCGVDNLVVMGRLHANGPYTLTDLCTQTNTSGWKRRSLNLMWYVGQEITVEFLVSVLYLNDVEWSSTP